MKAWTRIQSPLPPAYDVDLVNKQYVDDLVAAVNPAPSAAVLLASAWTGSTPPYVQTVDLPNSGLASVCLGKPLSPEQYEAAVDANVRPLLRTETTITFGADSVPALDIPVSTREYLGGAPLPVSDDVWDDPTPVVIDASVDLAAHIAGLPRRFEASAVFHLAADNHTAAAKALNFTGRQGVGGVVIESDDPAEVRTLEFTALRIGDVGGLDTDYVNLVIDNAASFHGCQSALRDGSLSASAVFLWGGSVAIWENLAVTATAVGVMSGSTLVLDGTTTLAVSQLEVADGGRLVLAAGYTGADPVIAGHGTVIDERPANAAGTFLRKSEYSPGGGAVAVEPVTLYIDADNGDDDSDGSQAAPLQSWRGMLDRLAADGKSGVTNLTVNILGTVAFDPAATSAELPGLERFYVIGQGAALSALETDQTLTVSFGEFVAAVVITFSNLTYRAVFTSSNELQAEMFRAFQFARETELISFSSVVFDVSSPSALAQVVAVEVSGGGNLALNDPVFTGSKYLYCVSLLGSPAYCSLRADLSTVFDAGLSTATSGGADYGPAFLVQDSSYLHIVAQSNTTFPSSPPFFTLLGAHIFGHIYISSSNTLAQVLGGAPYRAEVGGGGRIATNSEALPAAVKRAAFTLAAASWSGSGPWTQTVSVANSGVGQVGLAAGATAAQYEAAAAAGLWASARTSTSITVSALNEMPSIDIPAEYVGT